MGQASLPLILRLTKIQRCILHISVIYTSIVTFAPIPAEDPPPILTNRPVIFMRIIAVYIPKNTLLAIHILCCIFSTNTQNLVPFFIGI